MMETVARNARVIFSRVLFASSAAVKHNSKLTFMMMKNVQEEDFLDFFAVIVAAIRRSFGAVYVERKY